MAKSRKEKPKEDIDKVYDEEVIDSMARTVILILKGRFGFESVPQKLCDRIMAIKNYKALNMLGTWAAVSCESIHDCERLLREAGGRPRRKTKK